MNESTHWLVSSKVRPPERVPFHLDRRNLLEDIERTNCNLIVLRAPGGFGKTTLLAELCRWAKDRNRIAAWMTVDEFDTAESIEAYLPYAFEHAGLSMARSSQSLNGCLTELTADIGKADAPCLLVIDELERLRGTAVATLNYILHRSPGNLRIALGFRRNPGLDLSSAILTGRGIEFGPDWLRFTRNDIAEYLGGTVSRRKLDELAVRSDGWAFALSVYRYTESKKARAEAHDNTNGDLAITADWIGQSLFRSIDDEDGEFLMELAQFDWIESSIANEVLNRNDSIQKLTDLEALKGLVQRLDSDPSEYHLHALVKEYCSARLLRTNPDRYRELHRAIAEAMAKRGQIASAASHANESGDPSLIGHILVQAGGVNLFIREGMARLGNISELLTREVTDLYPRLAMLRCPMLVHQSLLAKARSLYERARLQTADFTRDPAGGNEQDLYVDGMYVRATLIAHGCLPFDDSLVEEFTKCYLQVKGEADRDPLIVAGIALIVFGAYEVRAMFEHAQQYMNEAAAIFSRAQLPHGIFNTNVNLGMVATARGRTAEAEERFALAARIADEQLLGGPLRQVVDVLHAELDLERYRMDRVQKLASTIRIPFRNGAAWYEIIAAAHEVIVACRFESGGADSALQALELLYDDSNSEGLIVASRHLLGLRINCLLLDGRVDDANREWRTARLPERDEELLRLDNQTWREVEVLACCRLRLLIAAGRLEAARALAQSLSGLAQRCGLARTLMRCVVLSMVLEHEAGDLLALKAHLIAFERLRRETGYSGPLLREPAARPILRSVLAIPDLGSDLRDAAESLLRQTAGTADAQTEQFTERELEIIQCLGQGMPDKEIARQLSITRHGVRYHLNNIYRKTGTLGRAEAVHWATRQGLVR